jgi:hypothetical protein
MSSFDSGGAAAQVVQVVGALLILGAFVMLQLGTLASTSRAYLGMNALGSGLLAILALLGSLWGFFLLEGAWAVVSVVSLLRHWSRRTPEPL